MSEEEYLFIAVGVMFSDMQYAVSLRNSKTFECLSFHLIDNVLPPLASRKFTRQDIVALSKYMTEYLERTKPTESESINE